MKRLQVTLRDLFWLSLVVACLCGWWVDRTATKQHWWQAFTFELNERIRYQSYYEKLTREVAKEGLEVDESGSLPRLKRPTTSLP